MHPTLLFKRFTPYSFNFYHCVRIDCAYIVLGKWINENSSKNASLAVWDAEAIPFYSNIRAIDIYPDSLQGLHLYNNPEDADYILGQNITFLILNDEYFSYIKAYVRFLNDYRLIFYAQFYYADIFYGRNYI